MTKEEELHGIYVWAMDVALRLLDQIEILKDANCCDLADLVRAIAEGRIKWVNANIEQVQA